MDPLNSFRFFGNAGSFQLAGLNETDRNPSLLVVVLKHAPETGAASPQGAYDARLSFTPNRKRGDQGVDALDYTERPEQRQSDLVVLARRSS